MHHRSEDRPNPEPPTPSRSPVPQKTRAPVGIVVRTDATGKVPFLLASSVLLGSRNRRDVNRLQTGTVKAEGCVVRQQALSLEIQIVCQGKKLPHSNGTSQRNRW